MLEGDWETEIDEQKRKVVGDSREGIRERDMMKLHHLLEGILCMHHKHYIWIYANKKKRIQELIEEK